MENGEKKMMFEGVKKLKDKGSLWEVVEKKNVNIL